MKKYIICLLFLILISCNKSSSNSIDWSKQPHIENIPQPVGYWTKNPTYSIDINDIYGLNDQNLKNEIINNTSTQSVFEMASLSTDLGLSPEQKLDNPDILIRFYYAPYVEGKIRSSTIINESINNGERCCFIDDLSLNKNISSYAWDTPPNAEGNYNGLSMTRQSGKQIKQVRVWINVYAYQYFKISHKNDPKFKIVYNQYVDYIIKHELGHAFWGLNDDLVGMEPGLMVYRSMQSFPNEKEKDVVRWLYKNNV